MVFRMFLLTGMFLLSLQFVFSQKQEVEKRIQSKDAPAKAIEWINEVTIKKKRLRWYFEVTSGKKSYEAKFIHNHDLYSVEFDTMGKVEDIEVLTSRSDLKESINNSIETTLEKAFDKFNIVKIQIQYTANDDRDLLNWINTDKGSVSKHFEIEFEAKSEGVWRMYEGTFDAAGNLLHKREIIIRSTENLNY